MIGTDDEPWVGILAGVFECERMICRVEDVCISDTVFARRRQLPLTNRSTKRLRQDCSGSTAPPQVW